MTRCAPKPEDVVVVGTTGGIVSDIACQAGDFGLHSDQGLGMW